MGNVETANYEKSNEVLFGMFDGYMVVPLSSEGKYSKIIGQNDNDGHAAVFLAPRWHEGKSFDVNGHPLKLNITPLKSRYQDVQGSNCPEVVTLDDSSLAAIVSAIAQDEMVSGDLTAKFRGLSDINGHVSHFDVNLVDGYTSIRNAIRSAKDMGSEKPVFLVEIPIDVKRN